MMKFYNPVKIYNYHNSRLDFLDLVQKKKILLFCTESSLDRLRDDKHFENFLLSDQLTIEHNYSANPSLQDLDNIAKKYIDYDIDIIVGLGGGSSMDAAKISAASIPALKIGYKLNELLDNESILNGLNIIDIIQIPTTAGTGSEVTPFATIWDYEKKLKKSLCCDSMYASHAFIDPYFLKNVPIKVALSTGLDALNQAFESIWNINSNNITKNFAIEAAALSLNTLPNIDLINTDKETSAKLATASLLAGIAISQTRTSICHSISYPLTMRFGLPHGLACAFSMIEVFKHNKNFIKDDIHLISSKIGKSDIPKIIETFFKKYNFYSMLEEFIPSQATILELLPEMYTVGRADNNISKITKSDLQKIIINSCRNANLHN